ncbi:T9SS type A sorting domain-containing protein [Riemerella columbipharyngis]|uniref:Por secretion system C-terminal sorting domain-containing protein n=1 Tax=Riemerella columbipharyngis TaxID=1071918 RepID=A0A1G7FTY4_9FLAO|nr:T9SS type A sorting domain-containing protein [Riemerella columbipharyngis]SDE79175.1 Por secretion system C-terminal sorting domain-containing protein [Riemerella columbipharyngis]
MTYNKGTLASLDLSANKELTALDIKGSKLSSLNIKNNPSLTALTCTKNNLTELNITQNTKLEEVECMENQIKQLDVSKNNKMYMLDLTSNKLVRLDLSGDYEYFPYLMIEDNPDLTCVKMKPGAEPGSAWMQDSGVEYSENCEGVMGVKELPQRSISVYPNPVKDMLYINSAKTPSEIKIYNASGSLVAAATTQKSINVKNLSKGFYVVHFVVDGNIIVKKIVKG